MAGIHVNAGKLNRRIQILSVGKDEDNDGYYVRQETLVHGRWAKVTMLSGRAPAFPA